MAGQPPRGGAMPNTVTTGPFTTTTTTTTTHNLPSNTAAEDHAVRRGTPPTTTTTSNNYNNAAATFNTTTTTIPIDTTPQPRNRLRSARLPPHPVMRRNPSIRLRRADAPQIPDQWAIPPAFSTQEQQQQQALGRSESNRRRSSSEPQRPSFLAPLPPAGLGAAGAPLMKQRTQELPRPLPRLAEEPSSPPAVVAVGRPEVVVPPRGASMGQAGADAGAAPELQQPQPTVQMPVQVQVQDEDGQPAVVPAVVQATPRRRSILAPFGRKRGDSVTAQQQQGEDEYENGVVDMLDVIDPEVSTLSTLTNVQNSLFIPDLGRFLNRRPVYTLTQREPDVEMAMQETSGRPDYNSTLGRCVSRIMTVEDRQPEEGLELRHTLTRQTTRASITSALTDSHYAVLPHGTSLDGWTENEKEELNDHVRHMLHSRRAKIKRGLKGFGQYVRRPLGFFVTLYATLITLFGLAWVLFLIGWISIGSKQLYVINVIDNVLVALFAIMGDGLAPFRTVDTYHMIFIAHYHRLTWRLRKQKNLPALPDHNDLPQNLEADTDQDDQGNYKDEFSVLTVEQQARLDHHAAKFSKSHTFYKPHETETHHAFPLKLLIAIVVLLDFHSIFQIALGACTWSISYHHRPFALTTVILCCSITCNVTAGVLITVGDRRTRKKDVVERIFRQELTQEAIRKVEKRREKEEREELEKAQQRKKEWEEKMEHQRREDARASAEMARDERSSSSYGKELQDWARRPSLDRDWMPTPLPDRYRPLAATASATAAAKASAALSPSQQQQGQLSHVATDPAGSVTTSPVRGPAVVPHSKSVPVLPPGGPGAMEAMASAPAVPQLRSEGTQGSSSSGTLSGSGKATPKAAKKERNRLYKPQTG